VSEYDPYRWDGPAFAREFLSPPDPALAQLHGPPAPALPNGGYSFCYQCASGLAPNQRCTTVDALHRLRSASADQLLQVACCPLDLADELAARRTQRAAVIEPIPQPESKPSRWRRWWRKAN
jgi:hypothetical protein